MLHPAADPETHGRGREAQFTSTVLRLLAVLSCLLFGSVFPFRSLLDCAFQYKKIRKVSIGQAESTFLYTLFMQCKTLETMCNKTMKIGRNSVEKNYGFKQVFVQHSSGIVVVLKDTETKLLNYYRKPKLEK